MANNNDNKVLNVPPLRFPEFSGEWKMCTIGELITKVGSGVTPRGGEAVYKTEGHPFVRSQNVGLGNLLLDDIAFIDEETHLRQKNTELQFNDVLLNITGASIGRSALVDKQIVGGNVNQHVCIIRTKENLVPSFICSFLLSNYGQRQIDSFQAGGNRQGLNFEQIKSIKITIPSKDEQIKIAKLLRAIDERIATQNKIIDKLQSLIKGIAQNVARNNKPNIRLSECLECSSSTLQESDVCKNGTYPVYGANGIVGYLDNYNTEKEAVYIIKDGSGVGTVSYVTGKCSATGTLNTLQAKEGYSLQYLYYMLKVFNFEPYKTGMAIPHIYFKDYGKAKIFCPSYTEQLKYARLLSAIDNKLSAEQSILTDLSLQKQYLLRQMFI
ncbi:restriction endonuclease subunit S [Parabacteroides merdae]|uniref:restriction endonuclease subunit S n=2 Tax=Parabacteroides merdae TaxID=46503 RepID=UPI000EFD1CF9|nr:restriction endonuclease subunit S [Parabacteroides merdae]MCG4937936.1 restriction endonuclease subunit S [Parabacteroides merdae]MCQ5222450.1 restriction endonuclease subunit S [Parabacteroides merdae]RHE97725.1 restriction endonuclease subunit S [Parabacteroides merdae]